MLADSAESSLASAGADVVVRCDNGVAWLSLNRPKAINALNLSMCQTMTEALLEWREQDAVRLILVDHAEGRGFCAGADIRALWESGKEDGAYARSFFMTEYRLNHLLFTYPKPVVAFMDGITMGGGVGISLPARYRVATDRTVFAMPESAIGLFPDVGAGWYLSRLPGRVGQFLALTGARLNGAECVSLGLATHYAASDAVDGIKASLSAASTGDVEAILAAASVTPPSAQIEQDREAIDRLFAADRYEDVLVAINQDDSEWAARQRVILTSKSPQTAKVSLRLLGEGRGRSDFLDEMKVEYRVAVNICQRHDFIEGVRAVIVDKDNAPHWESSTAEGVTEAVIDRIFAPLPADEEWTPLNSITGST